MENLIQHPKTEGLVNTTTDVPKLKDVTKRKDAYHTDPKNIIVEWSKNPRIYYGTEEEQRELEDQIEMYGVLDPINIYISKKDGKGYLAHGFRRMRAVHSLIARGVNITSVPYIKVDDNEETILKNHAILNSGMDFTDLEKAMLYTRYQSLSNKTAKEMAKDFGVTYNKMIRLLDFAKNAGSQLKDAVANNEIKMTSAVEIARQFAIADQNEIIEKGKANRKEGQKTIKNSDLPIKIVNMTVANVISQLKKYQDEESLNQDLIEKMIYCLDAMQNNEDTIVIDILSSFTPQEVQAQEEQREEATA